MKLADVEVGADYQLGDSASHQWSPWTDEPRRVRVVAIEKRYRHDTYRQCRIEYLTLAGEPIVDDTRSPWWRAAELTPWGTWYAGWSKRQSRRNHRASIRQRLADALHDAGLDDLVTVEAGQAGTVHMIIGDLADTEVVADRLHRFAEAVGGPRPR